MLGPQAFAWYVRPTKQQSERLVDSKQNLQNKNLSMFIQLDITYNILHNKSNYHKMRQMIFI